MATRRMIHKSISVSEQVARLDDFAQLLFTWMIPHADDWGCLPGSPAVVKALVIPLKQQTAEDVARALHDIEAAELIWWYDTPDGKVIQFRKWDKHQSGLHKRTAPKYLLYSQAREMQSQAHTTLPEVPGNSGKFPEASDTIPEVLGNSRLTELNRTEQNRTELKDGSSIGVGRRFDFEADDLDAIEASSAEDANRAIQEHLGVMNPVWLARLTTKFYERGAQPSLVVWSVRETVRAGAYSPQYLESILERNVRAGHFTAAAAQAASERWAARKRTATRAAPPDINPITGEPPQEVQTPSYLREALTREYKARGLETSRSDSPGNSDGGPGLPAARAGPA